MLRDATRLYPALWPAKDDRARTLARIEMLEREPLDLADLDPPKKGRAHWEAVWRAAHDAHFEYQSSDRSWEERQREMRALAAKLPALPVPLEHDDRDLIALLPPPAGMGPAWVAVYLHPKHHELARQAMIEMRNEWNHPGAHVERVEVPASTQPAIFHFAARSLVPVELTPFVDIHPHFFVETVWTDEMREMHEWHEAEDFSAMPTTTEAYVLAQQYGYGTKIGGFPVLNADDRDAPLWGEGDPMRYAYHLSASFFDVEFGDAGSLHVWLSPSTNEFACVMDCA
jgi:hypothetical protein